ncbi:Swarming motility protein ybiA [Termitomyces sp. T112]|nr:Swarming motility protein ybiA [Termitomyces sp. T112]
MPTYGQGFESDHVPMSPYNYDSDLGYGYSQGPDYTPVIPFEFQHLVPSSQHQYSKRLPVIPALPPQAPNPMQKFHAPGIPRKFGHVPNSQRRVPTPEVPLQQPNVPVQDTDLQMETASRERRLTGRRRKRNSLVLEVTMGDGEHTYVDRIRAGSQTAQRHPSTTADLRQSLSQDQRQYSSAGHRDAPSLISHTDEHSVRNNDRRSLTAEDRPDNVAEEHEMENVAPLASGSGRRINRVQTPYARPRSLEPSIDENSPISSPVTELSTLSAATTLITPGQFTHPDTHFLGANRGSNRSRARSVLSSTTSTDTPATPTTSLTTPVSNAHSTHAALPRSLYQPEPNPLPTPPVDIFELPEWQHMRYLLEIPPKRDNIGQVNVAIGESPIARSVSTASNARKQKKGLFRAFSFKRSVPPEPPLTRNGSARSPYSTGEAAVALLSRLAPYVVVNTTPQQLSQEPTGHQAPQPQATIQAPILNPTSPSLAAPTPLQPTCRFPAPNMPMAATYHPGASSSANAGPPPIVPSNHLSSVSPAQTRTPTQLDTHPPPFPEPQLHQPKRILFDANSEYSYFLMHSPHPVIYEDKTYPTAAHLLEALKFLPDYPEIAERIRQAKEHRDVRMISAENVGLVDPAFTAAVVENIHKVVSLKFRQHADLRYNLCDLDDDTQIVYNDPSDEFWGIGFDGHGMNELGMVLQRVMRELKPKRPSGPPRQVP